MKLEKIKSYDNETGTEIISGCIVSIKNNSTQLKYIRLFDEEYNDDEIAIHPGIPNITYRKIMRAIQTEKMIIKELYFCLQSEFYLNKISFIQRDIYGTVWEIPILVKRFPAYNKTTSIFRTVFFEELELNALSELCIDMPPESSLTVYAFPESKEQNQLIIENNKNSRSPYSLIINNTSNRQKKISLFESGFFENGDIQIETALYTNTYKDMFHRLSYAPFIAGKIELNSMNGDYKALKGIEVFNRHADGSETKLENFIIDPANEYSLIYDCNFDFSLSSNLNILIPSKTIFKIFIYSK